MATSPVQAAQNFSTSLDIGSQGFYAVQTMFNELARHRIHEHRVRLGLSPEQYGLRIRVSGMTVRRVEQGYTPFLSTQKKFADALGVSHLELFGMPALPDHHLQRRVAA